MSDTEAAPAPAPAPAKKAVAKPKKPTSHPPIAEMVYSAIANLKDKKGSSLSAIKKYVAANNKVDMDDRTASFLRRYLKKAVIEGKLTQTKGTGAAGSFKLAEEKKPKQPVAKKSKPAKKVKTPKKTAKKPAAKKAAKKSPKKTAKKATKSPKKEKKAKAAKPKKPKAKTAKSPKKVAAKKPAAKKPAAKRSSAKK